MKDVLVATLGLAAVAYLYMMLNENNTEKQASTIPEKQSNPKELLLNLQVKTMPIKPCNDCDMVNEYALPQFDAKGFMKF